MRVVLQKDMHTPPSVLDANLVTIYEGGQLVAAMWHRDDDTLALTRIGEVDFELITKELGLDKRTHVERSGIVA